MITTSNVYGTIVEVRKSVELTDSEVNAVYCMASWMLGIRVGRPAYRKFVRGEFSSLMNPPASGKVLKAVPGSAAEVAKAVSDAIRRIKRTAPLTTEAAKPRKVTTQGVVDAIPSIAVALSKPGAKNPEKAFYQAMQRRIKAGNTPAMALSKTLTPEAKAVIGKLVKEGAMAPDAIPGLRVRV